MRNEAGHEHQIDSALTKNMIGDVDIPALGITNGWLHGISLTS
jgi:hypothetical protein